VFLRGWVQRSRRRALKLPDAASGTHRFIGYPLAHVPLRRLDVEKLPDFFLWARCDAHGTAHHDRLLDDLSRWSPTRFSRSGCSALSDGRANTVVEQAALELKSWDGAVEDAGGRRTLVEVQLEQVRRRWQASLLARRPDDFPDPFTNGKIELRSSDDGWYETRLLRPEDGALLAEGLRWVHNEGGRRCTLLRSGRQAIALTPDRHFSGLISRNGLPLRGEFAVLCQDAVLALATKYLTDICNGPPQVLQPPTLPQGWSLLRGVHVVRRPKSVPPELEGLDVASTVEVTMRGGLRLGRASTWLAGAPPQVQVSGLDGEDVLLDGQAVEVNADGLVDAGCLLEAAGLHLLQVGSERFKIELCAPDAALPEASNTQQQENEADAAREQMLFLPRGVWILLGALPGQMARVERLEWQAASAACSFEAVWAVSAESAHEAVVIQVHPSPPLPAFAAKGAPLPRSPHLRELQMWAEVFYAIHNRRPRKTSLYGNADAPALWDKWAEAAKLFKRRLSKGR